MGHKNVASWVYTTATRDDEEQHSGRVAAQCIKDLNRADAIIAFTDAYGSEWRGGARHTEFGMAVAMRLELFIVGEPEIIFHHLPNVKQFRSPLYLLSYLATRG